MVHGCNAHCTCLRKSFARPHHRSHTLDWDGCRSLPRGAPFWLAGPRLPKSAGVSLGDWIEEMLLESRFADEIETTDWKLVVYEREDRIIIPGSLPTSGVQFAISNDAVIAAGKDLKSLAVCGPDGIPLLVIKRCWNSIAAPLTTVFNLYLTTGVFPNFWKESHVFSVLKKGCKRTLSQTTDVLLHCALRRSYWGWSFCTN